MRGTISRQARVLARNLRQPLAHVAGTRTAVSYLASGSGGSHRRGRFYERALRLGV